MKVVYLLVTLAILSVAAMGQQLFAPGAVDGNGQPYPQQVTICSTNPGGGTCSSLVTTYTDFSISNACNGTGVQLSNVGNPTITAGCSNPGFADNNGNVVAFAAAGSYWCQYSGKGIIPYSKPCPASSAGGTGTVTNTAGNLTLNSVVLGAGVHDTKVSTGITTNGASELDLGVSGTNGVLGLNGSTSGKATFTAPAVAGTATNQVVITNVTGLPFGAAATPSYGFSGEVDTGMYMTANDGNLRFSASGTQSAIISSGTLAGTNIGISLNGDNFLSRVGAGLAELGQGAGTSTGKLELAGVISVGTKFTTNNGCTDSATAGGATAGTFTVGSTSCTEVVTMGNSATAPNGWSCTVVDITTLADVTNPHQTTSNATTATFVTGTVASGDKIQFSCIGY